MTLNTAQQGKLCEYHAPYFAYRVDGFVWKVVQGSCNHWDCPRCGQIRATEEYWRVVNGALELYAEGHKFYFLTLTCGGRNVSLETANEHYYTWTHKFLDNFNKRAKAKGAHWCYVQITERQKRGHPHSHILTTYAPDDIAPGIHKSWRIDNAGKRVYSERSFLQSPWVEKQLTRAGLGEQYDLTPVRDIAAASRYVAKYLFKSALHTVYPKHWKRIRYSQSWPKFPQPKTDAMALIRPRDWWELAGTAAVIRTAEQCAFDTACAMLKGSDCIVVHPSSSRHLST